MLSLVSIADGTKGFLYHGAVGRTYEIQASTNMVNWQPLGRISHQKNVNQFVDKRAREHPNRFYRVMLVQ